jgi:hypothetical protein
MPAGRPSKFKPEFVAQAEKLCLLGATDQEIADFFEVEVRTIYRWKADNDAFCHALKAGKEAADERVERSLYQKAIGYEQDEVKIFMPSGAAEPVYAPFRAKVAPDTTAAIFWLKNRRSQEWRDARLLGSDPANPLPSAVSIDAGKLSTEALREIMAARSDATDPR